MTPTEAIAMLDRQIAQHGQSINIRRGAGQVTSMRAVVRGYRPEQIAGLVTQADRQVILSPSQLGDFGVPAAQDHVSISGKPGRVQAEIEPIEIDGTLVRVNMRVRMG